MQRTELPAVSVIVTVFNEALTIEALLHALVQQTQSPEEIIITDGGSTDTTVALIEQFSSVHPGVPIRVLSVLGNRSVGRNAACRAARSKLIACTDAGCTPQKNWLELLVKRHLTTQVPVVAGYYTAQKGTPFMEAGAAYVLVMPGNLQEDAFLPATRSMLFEKEVWKQVGGFDERYSDNEDYVFAHELRRHNIPIAFSRDAVVEWQPRKNLTSFAYMIFRFARGDIVSGIVRPKVVFIFFRYLAAAISLFMCVYFWGWMVTTAYFLLASMLYIGWSISKNARYATQGWYWLPVLQVTSDVAVMYGSIFGLLLWLQGAKKCE
jgi:glycosyltransferase involved in cell wall biosynthesis